MRPSSTREVFFCFWNLGMLSIGNSLDPIPVRGALDRSVRGQQSMRPHEAVYFEFTQLSVGIYFQPWARAELWRLSLSPSTILQNFRSCLQPLPSQCADALTQAERSFESQAHLQSLPVLDLESKPRNPSLTCPLFGAFKKRAVLLDYWATLAQRGSPESFLKAQF